MSTVLTDQEVRLAAICALDGMTTTRLARLLTGRSVDAVWAALADGLVGMEMVLSKEAGVHRCGIGDGIFESTRESLLEFGVRVTGWHDPDHPAALVHDIDPAPVLFRRGRPLANGAARVGIVGTRRCSGAGREVAYELGHDLAASGVSVVSGLAIGVDGAAHRGSLAAGGAPPIAVVGSGLDVVYPRSNTEIWHGVAEVGMLCSEAPMGAEPAAWRFPARNRLIAALSDVLVVVESRSAGGSLLTVEQAIRRGVDVMAVPGSLRNGAADGTNQLLVDGCAPVRSADDVLMVLGMSSGEITARRCGEPRLPTGESASVLFAVDDGPTSVEQLVIDTGLGLGAVYAALEELVAAGFVVRDGARVRRS